jgi:xanthine dehydrogenase YagR molybdenum-binding subunit
VASWRTSEITNKRLHSWLNVNCGLHDSTAALQEIVRLRVTRWVTVINGGRIINAKTARSQIIGAVVMGIGMGLLEETIYDTRTAQPINNNFADYLVAVNADVPEIDCVFLDYPDTILNEYGARGIGEIGLTGCASALTSAAYHATGIRIRELPIRIEKLMGS